MSPRHLPKSLSLLSAVAIGSCMPFGRSSVSKKLVKLPRQLSSGSRDLPHDKMACRRLAGSATKTSEDLHTKSHATRKICTPNRAGRQQPTRYLTRGQRGARPSAAIKAATRIAPRLPSGQPCRSRPESVPDRTCPATSTVAARSRAPADLTPAVVRGRRPVDEAIRSRTAGGNKP